MDLSLRQIGFFAIGCLLALTPVVGTNWLVNKQANAVADQHLQNQVMFARENAEMRFSELIEQLRNLSAADAGGCTQRDIERMQSLTLEGPAVSLVAMLDSNNIIICGTPATDATILQFFQEPTRIFDGDVTLAQVRLAETRTTGLLLQLNSVEPSPAVFIPRQMLPYFFDRLDERTGVVLTLGETVLFTRDPMIHSGAQARDFDVVSLPLGNESMRVQTSIDRQVILASYAPIARWATIGSIVLGALIVLLVTRLIRYTPAHINEIERAIEAGEFVPYYQPTIDIDSGKLVGCEVLVRWVKPDGTVVSPGAFIGLAEQTGLAVPMTRKLMQSVVDDLQEAYAGRPGLKVAINLFNQHFNSLDVINDVETIFGPSAITYSQVVLEITERAPLESLSKAKVIMRKLQGLGCRLALDDAGTGHGGLAYLQELGLDIVKIDKMFIDQLGKSRIGESITHTLTELAGQLDMDVVAEGIERIEQVTHLRRFGIRHAQGYLFAPALPAKQYLALVAKLGVAEPTRKLSSADAEASLKAATIREAARQISSEEQTDKAANAA
ncbi:MAG: EAL domain-containing protein [Devosiaceae bacterium]